MQHAHCVDVHVSGVYLQVSSGSPVSVATSDSDSSHCSCWVAQYTLDHHGRLSSVSITANQLSLFPPLNEFSSLQGIDNMRAPTFNRRQVQEWRKPRLFHFILTILTRHFAVVPVYYQEQIAQQVRISVMQLGGTQGHLLSRRPFQTTWYCSQVLICLELWRLEPTLTHALELGKSFLIPLDTLNVLWPCAGNVHSRADIRRSMLISVPNVAAQALHCQELRDRLTRACAAAGLPPPLPADVVLPPVLRRTAL